MHFDFDDFESVCSVDAARAFQNRVRPERHRFVTDVPREGDALGHECVSDATATGKRFDVKESETRNSVAFIDGDDVAAARDRAILLLGFSAALRRSGIAAVKVEDLRWSKEGLVLNIPRSKTDQLGEGADIAIPFVGTASLCAARAVRRYAEIAGISSGPLFRAMTAHRRLLEDPIDGRVVARLVKRLAARASISGDWSGHSLRAGFCTAAAAARVGLPAIARTTRHKSLQVLLGYVRPQQIFDDVALSSVIA